MILFFFLSPPVPSCVEGFFVIGGNLQHRPVLYSIQGLPEARKGNLHSRYYLVFITLVVRGNLQHLLVPYYFSLTGKINNLVFRCLLFGSNLQHRQGTIFSSGPCRGM